VRVPPPATSEVLPARVDTTAAGLVYYGRLPLRIMGQIPRLIGVEVSYDVSGDIGIADTTITIDYLRRRTVERTPEGWATTIDLNLDRREIQIALSARGSLSSARAEPTFRAARARILAGNEEWVSPIGTFDPEILVEPGFFSNVENGFGFVGAGYPIELDVAPIREVLQAAGFRVEDG
jgi:hypothetical protein